MFKITTAIVLLSFAIGALAQNAPIRFKRETKLTTGTAVYTTTSGSNSGATSGSGGTGGAGGGNNGSGGCWNNSANPPQCVPASANGCAQGFAFNNPPTPCP